jgi:two-component system response regulator MprA
MARVLVVDDDPALREMLGIILESEGYEVARARDGAEAVACLQSGWQPAVMLLDVLMPVMDGGAVCEWVAAHLLPHERPRLVILSASLAPGTRFPLADAQLSKPFGVDAVLSLVRHFCPQFSCAA